MIPDLGEVLFFLIAALVVLSGYWVVMSPNLVHSAVSLLFTLFGVAGLYVYLYADFIAVSQVIIYVGGILVFENHARLFCLVLPKNDLQNWDLTEFSAEAFQSPRA